MVEHNMYNSRYICTVIEEMRKYVDNVVDNIQYKKHILSLVEEMQTLANRMEAALEDYGEEEWLAERVEDLKEKKRKLKKELLQLRKEKSGLEK